MPIVQRKNHVLVDNIKNKIYNISTFSIVELCSDYVL